MPVYEYFCRECGSKFEKLRSMSAANEPAACPGGHDGAIRTLSVIARVAGSDGGQANFGGCCGGACGCGAA